MYSKSVTALSEHNKPLSGKNLNLATYSADGLSAGPAKDRDPYIQFVIEKAEHIKKSNYCPNPTGKPSIKSQLTEEFKGNGQSLTFSGEQSATSPEFTVSGLAEMQGKMPFDQKFRV